MKGVSFIYIVFALVFTSCLHDKYEPQISDSGYPSDVEQIILTRCAGTGCHNAQDKAIAGGLDLSTWDHLFEGSVKGTVVVPFADKFSSLLYVTNTDTLEGVVGLPTMPYELSPLSRSEYLILRDWIINGAANIQGEVKYAEGTSRKKIYIANTGCDKVTVLNASDKKIMRYVDVGNNAIVNEGPTLIEVTPDNSKWAVLFSNNNIIQIYDAVSDDLISTITLPAGVWTDMVLSNDSKKAYLCDYSSGMIVFVDIESGQLLTSYNYGVSLGGLALNSDQDTLLVTCPSLGYFYKVPVTNPANYNIVDLSVSGSVTNPTQIVFTPDYEHYMIVCDHYADQEIRVYNAITDRYEESIHLYASISRMAVAPNSNLLFVTCENDNFFPGIEGSVRVIDLSDYHEVIKIKAGWQPYGIEVDESEGLVYVSNRNHAGTIYPPYYAAVCAGQNGKLSLINLNTYQLLPVNTELSVDPSGIGIRY